MMSVVFFFFQAEDGIRDAQESRGLGDVYKRQALGRAASGVGSGGGTVLGGLGALGVTAATLTTVLKSTSQALLRRLRQDVYSDLVALAATVVPTYPSGRRAGWLRRASAGPIVRRAVQSRQLTVATAAPDQPAVATG